MLVVPRPIGSLGRADLFDDSAVDVLVSDGTATKAVEKWILNVQLKFAFAAHQIPWLPWHSLDY